MALSVRHCGLDIQNNMEDKTKCSTVLSEPLEHLDSTTAKKSRRHFERHKKCQTKKAQISPDDDDEQRSIGTFNLRRIYF